MLIYLPIAEISVHAGWLILMGGAVGVISGIFGVGGGFLMTPLLLFIGIPAPVAVATSANHVVATSISALIAHWRMGNVDFRMGGLLLGGGLIGASCGVWLFSVARGSGQIDLIIRLTYVLFLGSIGTLMLIESLVTNIKRNSGVRKKLHQHSWIHGLPFRLRFRKSKLYISILPPLVLGGVVGLLASVMGIGGGFIIIPAMIYILGMPTIIVVATSLFQIVFVMALVTILHAASTQTVDILLATLLLVGGVIGAQIGVRLGTRLRGEELRALLGLLVLLFTAMVGYGLVDKPDDLYVIEQIKQR